MKRFISVLMLLLWPLVAFAQQSTITYPAPWSPVGNTVSLSVSNTSSNVQLGWVGVVPSTQAPPSVWVCNTGSVNAYVLLGTSSAVVVTTSTGFPLINGQCNSLSLSITGGPATYIAGITAASSTTLAVSAGNGSPLAKHHGTPTPTNNNLTADDGSTNLTADDGSTVLTSF